MCEVPKNTILIGDVLDKLKELPDGSVQCCVTSPPYWNLRDYGTEGQIGLEKTPEEYVQKLVEVFREVRRVLRNDGTVWLNLGDSYAGSNKGSDGKGGFSVKSNIQLGNVGSFVQPVEVPNGLKPKDLVGIPWRMAFALQQDGWWLRQDIIWHKPNPMPESVTDRCTKGHEYIFLLTKSSKYYYDAEAVKEPYTEPMNRWGGTKLDAKGKSTWDEGTGQVTYRDRSMRPDPNGRNRRSVWEINTNPFRGAHFATFPEELPEICIKAGTSEKGCCEKCGSPYERIIERQKIPDDCYTGSNKPESINAVGNHKQGFGQKYQDFLANHPSKTVGWQSSCKCNAGVKPCVVLDPFFGSGTTGVVARKLKCDWIGVELNPDYADIAEKRLAGFENWFILKDIKDGKQRQLEVGR